MDHFRPYLRNGGDVDFHSREMSFHGYPSFGLQKKSFKVLLAHAYGSIPACSNFKFYFRPSTKSTRHPILEIRRSGKGFAELQFHDTSKSRTLVPNLCSFQRENSGIKVQCKPADLLALYDFAPEN